MVRKWGSSAILLISLAISSNSAFATDGPCGDQDAVGSFLCGAFFVTMSPIGTTIGLTGMTTQQNRSAYIAQVRDDAAEYIAADGANAPSAVLRSALQTIRQNKTETASMNDLELAQTVIGSQN